MNSQDIIEINGKKYKFIPFKDRNGCSEFCIFRNASFADCCDIPCIPEERKDKRKGYFVEISEEAANKINSNNMNQTIENFDIEKAKAGKPVCTRDGRKARIICFDRNDNTPIVALIECVNRTEILQCYYNDGRCYHYETSKNDLMMIHEKMEGWVNVYKIHEEVVLSRNPFNTEEEAINNAVEGCGKEYYVDTIKIEWEE